MLIVETIRKVRLALAKGESQREVAKKYRMSRNTVRKIATGEETEFKYSQREVSYPVLGPHIEQLKEMLEKEAKLPPHKRQTGKKIYNSLQNEGYEGGYDAVRRYIRSWKEEQGAGLKNAYVPQQFGRGEAFQFDWSQETIELGGVERKIEVAQFCLCYSRMKFCMAFEREELSMVIEAHIQAHNFFGGLCERGIYDNPKTIVQSIGKGKDREYNQKFLQLSSHYLFEPCACTPSSGWEKGRIERQVGANRKSIFTPCLRFANLKDLNEHLKEQVLLGARNARHPEIADKNVYDVYEEEKPYLRSQVSAFGGYDTEERRAGVDCLVRFDGNHYSVPCEYAGKPVSVRKYASRVVIAVEGKTVAEHERKFEKGRYVTEPLHYLPLLERKPGALRNGRPFVNWELPSSIRKVWEVLRRYADWDRQMSALLSTIPTYGLEALSVACSVALEENAVSQSTIMNYLTRLTEEAKVSNVAVSGKFKLMEEPRSDCSVYNQLLLGKSACCAKAY
jgi:transposase